MNRSMAAFTLGVLLGFALRALKTSPLGLEMPKGLILSHARFTASEGSFSVTHHYLHVIEEGEDP